MQTDTLLYLKMKLQSLKQADSSQKVDLKLRKDTLKLQAMQFIRGKSREELKELEASASAMFSFADEEEEQEQQ